MSLRHREEQLEAARDDAERQLEQRRVDLPTTEEIKEYVADFRDFLKEGTVPECKALIRNFVEGIEVSGDEAVLMYTIPMPSMTAAVDVLFVDEAGQMSLADALAASPCARSLVLLGDPQQLDQPLQGTHPPGAELSVLAHVLDGEPVMPDHLGLFLDGSWRLHPDISAYTSDVFYEGRLHSHPGRDRLALAGVPPLSGTGIRFVPVPHSGQSSESPEEAAVVAELVRSLLDASPTHTDASGASIPLAEADVLLITPYNAQVRALSEALPGFRIGTVDKFQGQEAPISIYSMATSSSEEAPHGMEFLYGLNRLNVATSRAQCVALIVASPTLLRVRCRTPRQMRLANALARLMEMAANSA